MVLQVRRAPFAVRVVHFEWKLQSSHSIHRLENNEKKKERNENENEFWNWHNDNVLLINDGIARYTRRQNG